MKIIVIYFYVFMVLLEMLLARNCLQVVGKACLLFKTEIPYTLYANNIVIFINTAMSYT